MNLRQLALVGLAALAVGGTAVAQVGQQSPSSAATPPPPPPPNGTVATPGTLLGTPAAAASSPAGPTLAPSSTAPAGHRGRRAPTPAASPEASPSESPEPPQFQTMDGVWEVQLQPLNGSGRTLYSHLFVVQKGDALSGTWVRNDKTKIPFTGTFDGRLFKLTLTDGKSTMTMSGYAENFGDMVGLLLSSDPKDKGTPFTAAHRKKEKIS